MAGHFIKRATFCTFAIAFYLCLLSYSSISGVLASPYPGEYSLNDRLVEREPLVACSAVKGLHIECSPDGKKPNLNVLNKAPALQGSTKKTARNVQRRENDLLVERAPLFNFRKSLVESSTYNCFEHELNLLRGQGTDVQFGRREVPHKILY